jgi:hypothetical protein
MHRSVFAGYPANTKAGYRISGRILGMTTIFLKKYLIIKKTDLTIIDFSKD